jgi:hypothetical protein
VSCRPTHIIRLSTNTDNRAIKFAEEQGGKYPKKRPIMTGFTYVGSPKARFLCRCHVIVADLVAESNSQRTMSVLCLIASTSRPPRSMEKSRHSRCGKRGKSGVEVHDG